MKKAISTIILVIAIAVLWNSADVLAVKDYRLIKTADDAKVFLVKENRRIHIPNPSVFEAGGYKWGDIETVTKLQMNKIANTALIKSPVSAKVYLIADGKKQWIPDETTFLGAGLQWADIVLITQPQVEFYLEENFNQSDATAVVESLNSSVIPVVENSSDIPNITNTNNLIDNYERPEEIKIQEIGKYKRVDPDISNTSIENTRLFADGSVLFAKNTMDGDEFISKKYIWKDGVSTLNTEAYYLIDMNDSGQKVVVDYDLSDHPFFLNNGKMTEIPTLGGHSVGVSDMNNSGQLVGGSDLRGGGIDGGVSHAFLWQNGVMKDLGTFGGSESHAIAINDKGQIIGYSQYDDNKEADPFIWENNKMSKILIPNGYYLSSVDDINNNGLILGQINTKGDDCKTPACLSPVYFKNNNLVYLEAGDQFVDVNNHDEMVGIMEDPYWIDKIWSHYTRDMYEEIVDRAQCGSHLQGYATVHINGDSIKLDDLIGDDNIKFTSAKAINDRGEILATGFDFRDDYSHEYLISLPKNIPPTFDFTVDGDNTVYTEEEYLDEYYDQFLVENPRKYEVTWTDSSSEENAKISLYYYYDDIGNQPDFQAEGELLVSGLSVNSKVDKYVWDMTNLKPGHYYLYAIIDDGKTKIKFESDQLKNIISSYQRALEIEDKETQEENVTEEDVVAEEKVIIK
ncbi:MAG: DUF3466 family protein [Candidatus Magasanikbacteria bacterium]